MYKHRISVTERDPGGPFGFESILNDTAKHLVAYAFDSSLIQTEDELGCSYKNVDEYVYISPHAYIIRKPVARRTYKDKLYKKKFDDVQYRQNSIRGGLNREYKHKEYKKKFNDVHYHQNSTQGSINRTYKQKEYKKKFDDAQYRQNVHDGWDDGTEREFKRKEYKKKFDDAQNQQNVQNGRDDGTERGFKRKEYKTKFNDVQYGRDQTSHIHQDEKPSASRDYDKSSLCESLAIIKSANMLARWAIDTSQKELQLVLERECGDTHLKNITTVTKERLAKEVVTSRDRSKKTMNQRGGTKKENYAKPNRVREPDSAAYEVEARKLVQIVIDTVLSEMESEFEGKERDHLAHRVSGYDSVIAAQALWLVEDVMDKATSEMQEELNCLQQHITETQSKNDVDENELSKLVGKIVKIAIKNAIFEVENDIENTDSKCSEWSTQDKDSRKIKTTEMVSYTAADLARLAIRESISDIAQTIRQSARTNTQKTSAEKTDVDQLPVLKKEDDDRKSDRSTTSYSTEASTSSYRSHGKQEQQTKSVKQGRQSMYRPQSPATLKKYHQQREKDEHVNKTSVSVSVSKSHSVSDEDSFTSKTTHEPYESKWYHHPSKKQLSRQAEGRASIGFDYALHPQGEQVTGRWDDRAINTLETRRDVRGLSRPLDTVDEESLSEENSRPNSGEYDNNIAYYSDGESKIFQHKAASCDPSHTKCFNSDSEVRIQKSVSFDPKYGKSESPKKEADINHKALHRTINLTDIRKLNSDYCNIETDWLHGTFQQTFESYDSRSSTSGYSKTKIGTIQKPLHEKLASCDSKHSTLYYSDSENRIKKSVSFDPKYGKSESPNSDYGNTETDRIQGTFQQTSESYDSRPSTSGYSKAKIVSTEKPLHEKSASCDIKIKRSVSFDPKYGKSESSKKEADMNYKTSYYSSKEIGYTQKTISFNPKYEKCGYPKNETDTIHKPFEQSTHQDSLDSSQIPSHDTNIEVNSFHKPFQQKSASFDSRHTKSFYSNKEADKVKKSASTDSKYVTSDFYRSNIEENILLQKLLSETETGRSATEQVFQKLLDSAICHRASLIAKKALVASLLETNMEERIQYGLLVLNIKYALNLKISECAISAETLARDARNFANELFYAIPDKTTKNVLRVRGETIKGFDVKLNFGKLKI